MMNLDNYYIHATGGFWGTKNKENKIIDILRDGKISVNSINKNHKESPDNQICFCDTTRPVLYKNKNNAYLSSFEHFVLYSPSLILSRDFDVIIPEYGDNNEEEGKKGLADCYDEVRYDKDLSLEHLKFITFPLLLEDRKKVLSDENKMSNLKVFKKNILVISKEFKTIPIKDIYTGHDITVEDIEKQIEIYQKKVK